MLNNYIWYNEIMLKIDNATSNRINKMLLHLDERQKRLYLAAEAESLGRGGIKIISEYTGVHRNTIAAGIKDLNDGTILNGERQGSFRIRKEGGGRKNTLEKYPEIKDELRGLVENNCFGNPENPLLWTTKSLRKLAKELNEKGYKVSHVTVGKILEQMGFSLQINQKMKQVGKESPDRNEQFEHINETVIEYSKNNDPVISIDCKKKENIGNFKNNGAEYLPKKQPTEVLDHDFPIPENGKVLPYGVYDITYNEGYVNVGISKDTAKFAVQSIRTWWYEMGKNHFPNAQKLYITADGGGSNGSRCKLWKTELQLLADEIKIPIEVSHFPPGTSKWNKIEHRMFSQISKNWRGRPLETLSIIVNLIASTTTNTGLKIKCGIDNSKYETGIKVSDEEIENLNISRNSFHGEWNYVISPH